VVSLTLRPLYSKVKAPDTHSIGGWVGPSASMDAIGKTKKIPSCPCLEMNSGRPARNQVPIPAPGATEEAETQTNAKRYEIISRT